MLLSPAEFDASFVGLRPELVAHAAHRLHDTEAAEDVASDCYLRARVALASFEGKNLRAWLMSTVNNCCHDHLKQQCRETPTDPGRLPVRVRTDGYAELRSVYYKYLHTHCDLTAAQSKVIRWSADGFSQQAIAQRLRITQPAVNRLLRRARKRAEKNFSARWPGFRTGERVTNYHAPTTQGSQIARQKLGRLR